MAEKPADDLKKPSSDKLKALQLAMDKIEKDHGKGTIMRMGDNKIEDVAVISTGSIGLNIALGVGGYPRGRVIEIYGPESSGKQLWLYMPLPKHKKRAALQPLSMPNMLSTVLTPKNWG